MVAGPAELPSDGFQDTQLLKRRGPSFSPISSAILPFSTRRTVVSVKCIFLATLPR